jgi:hypothetical protein
MAMDLERLLIGIYDDLSSGLVAVSISSRRAAMVQKLPNGAARVEFRSKTLDCVAEFRDGILQVNLANGERLATVVDRELIGSTASLRRIRV